MGTEHSNSGRILFVASERLGLHAGASLLDRCSVMTSVAQTADQALSMAHVQRPLAVVLPLDPPGMTTDALCAAFRSDSQLKRIQLIGVAPEDANQAAVARLHASLDHLLVGADGLARLPAVVAGLLKTNVRREPRLSVNILASLQRRDAPSGQGGSMANLVELGACGMRIEVAEALSTGTNVLVSFFLPGRRERLCCPCVVGRAVEMETLQYGLEILDSAKDEISAITGFLTRRGCAPDVDGAGAGNPTT